MIALLTKLVVTAKPDSTVGHADAILGRACSKSDNLILNGESLPKDDGIDTPIYVVMKNSIYVVS